ncbi:MAG: heme ABC transporter permease [Proteobacteria bacterium]|nr:heme ABC transporter permease [Pseudomonadota bacterium]
MSNALFALANPARFRKVGMPLLWVSSAASAALFAWGLWLALLASPADYLQQEAVRIMYIHVPAAWMALGTYSSLAFAALSFLIWRHTLAGLYIRAMAPVGAAFTAICLITGSIWGQPTWGTWWVWDARLTSVLVLFFLYAGIIALADAFENRERGLKAAAWLSLIGMVNLPVIKFSVDWWNTLHQPPSVSSFARMVEPAVDKSMLTPLLAMAGAYLFLFIALAVLRLESEIMSRRIESARMRRNHG